MITTEQTIEQTGHNDAAGTTPMSSATKKQRKGRTPKKIEAEQLGGSQFGQPNVPIRKRRRILIEDDGDTNSKKSPVKTNTPLQPSIASLFKKAVTPKPKEEDLVQIPVQTPKAKNLYTTRITSFISPKKSPASKSNLPNTPNRKNVLTPSQIGSPVPSASPIKSQSGLTPLKTTSGSLNLVFKDEEVKNQELKFESENPVQQNIGAQVENQQLEQQKVEVKEQLAEDHTQHSQFKGEVHLDEADAQLAFQKQEIVNVETETEAMQDQDLSIAPVGRPLVTVQTVISILEKQWSKQDQPLRLTDGCKALTEWLDRLSSMYEMGEFLSSQNLKSQECLQAFVRFCQPKHFPKKLTNYKDYQFACQNSYKAKQCTICYKWLARIRNTRHNTCFDDGNLHTYRMPCYKGSYFCLLCVELYSTKELLADHYIEAHHPLDVKFIGLNAILIKRKTPDTMNYGRDLVTTANRQGWPAVGHGGKSITNTELEVHLDSGAPFFSMLEDYVSKNTSFTLPRTSSYEVIVFPNKIVYSYRVDVYKQFLFAGGGLDQTISVIHSLGKLSGNELYGWERVERCTTYVNIVRPLIGFKDRNRLRQFRNLRPNEMQEDAEVWFTEILIEVEKLQNAGVYALEAHNVNHWYLDTMKQRVIYLAPHWMTPSLKIANQIGFATVQLSKTDPVIKLTGVHGLYTSAVLAAYNYILMKHGKLMNWDLNVDQNGRIPVFVVSTAERSIAKSTGDKYAEMMMEPLKKLIRNNAKTSAPAEVTIKQMSKTYMATLKGKPIIL